MSAPNRLRVGINSVDAATAAHRRSSKAMFVAVGLALATLALLVGGALLGEGGVSRHGQLEEEIERVEAVNRGLRKENRRIAIERRALRHDETYIEAVIRDDLGYIRPDEVVIELERSPPTASKRP